VYAPHPISLEDLSLRAGAPTPYPAFTYVPLVPFALLPWPIVKGSVLLLDCVLFFLVLRTLADVSQLAGFHRDVWVAAALLFAPFSAGMDSNNIVVWPWSAACWRWGPITAAAIPDSSTSSTFNCAEDTNRFLFSCLLRLEPPLASTRTGGRTGPRRHRARFSGCSGLTLRGPRTICGTRPVFRADGVVTAGTMGSDHEQSEQLRFAHIESIDPLPVSDQSLDGILCSSLLE
jgi:hypothetical protein